MAAFRKGAKGFDGSLNIGGPSQLVSEDGVSESPEHSNYGVSQIKCIIKWKIWRSRYKPIE